MTNKSTNFRHSPDQMRHLKADLDHFVGQVERRLDGFETDLEQIVTAVNMLVRGSNPDVDEVDSDDALEKAKIMLDSIWECTSCGSRLAVVDEKKDEMRLKYRNQMIYVTPGDGGSVTVICRKCGKLNTVEGSKQPKPE